MPLLWSIQTQKPEWIAPDKIAAALASGNYREYEGSLQQVSIGEEEAGAAPVAIPAGEAAVGLETGSVRAAPSTQVRGENVLAQKLADADTFVNEYLSLGAGAVRGLSLGLLQPEEWSAQQKLASEANPTIGTVGEVVGIVGGALAAPESLLAKTPGGLVFRAAGRAGDRAAASIASPLARSVVKEGVAGAVENAALATGYQLGNVLWTDKPFSAEAIVNEAGLGLALGGGLGALAGGAGRVIQRARSTEAAVSGLDDAALELRGAGQSWDDALSLAKEKVDLAKKVQFEAMPEIRGAMESRYAALEEAERARKRLLRALGGGRDAEAAPWARLEQILESGSPAKIQHVAEQLDIYGSAVSKLDDVMTPRDLERALAPDPIMLRPGPRGSPGILGRVEDAADTNVDLRVGPAEEAALAAQDQEALFAELSQLRRGARGGDTAAISPAAIAREVGGDIRNPMQGSQFVTESMPGVDGTGPTGPLNPKIFSKKRRGPAFTPGLAMPPEYRWFGKGEWAGIPRPTALGENIAGRLRASDDALGEAGMASAALDLAERLGVNVRRTSGPVGERVVQLWALRRQAKGILRGGSKEGGILGKMARDMVDDAMAGLGYHFGGPIGYGAARAAMSFGKGIGGAVTASKVKMAEGVDRLLHGRVGKIVAGTAAVRAAYESGERRTSDFKTKAEALTRLSQDPTALREFAKTASAEVGKMDPDLGGLVAAVMAQRVTNLAARVPETLLRSPLDRPEDAPENQEAVRRFELYERITHKPDEALAFVNAGAVPAEVIDAIHQQHPEWISKLTAAVLADPDRLRRAPQATLVGLSQLLKIPLVTEADPNFIARQQAVYQQKRQESQATQEQQAGAAAIRGGGRGAIPTLGQTLAVPTGGNPANLRG